MSSPSFPGGPWTQQLGGDGAGKSVFAMIMGGLELAAIVVVVLAAVANSHG